MVIVHAERLHTSIPYGEANPLDSPICRDILETAKRSKNTPVNKKKPITPSIIRDIIEKYSDPQPDLKSLRLACMCSLGFAGFLRYNELANICISNTKSVTLGYSFPDLSATSTEKVITFI